MSSFNEKARRWLQQEGVNTEQPSTSPPAEAVEPAAAAGVDSVEIEVLRERLAAFEAEAEWNRSPDLEKRRINMERSRANFSTTPSKVWGHDPAETKILPPRSVPPPPMRPTDVMGHVAGHLHLRDGRVLRLDEAKKLGIEDQYGYVS